MYSSQIRWVSLLALDHPSVHPVDNGGLSIHVVVGAIARPAPDSPQWGDAPCLSLSIDETGRRGASPGPVEECWR